MQSNRTWLDRQASLVRIFPVEQAESTHLPTTYYHRLGTLSIEVQLIRMAGGTGEPQGRFAVGISDVFCKTYRQPVRVSLVVGDSRKVPQFSNVVRKSEQVAVIRLFQVQKPLVREQLRSLRHVVECAGLRVQFCSKVFSVRPGSKSIKRLVTGRDGLGLSACATRAHVASIVNKSVYRLTFDNGTMDDHLKMGDSSLAPL